MSGLWRQLFGGGSSSQQLQESAKFSLIKNITITQTEIDRGSYGVIYKAIYCGKECVAKEIHSILLENGGKSNTVVQSFIREVNILSTLRHPSIVHFLGVHFRESSRVPILIMEKMWISLGTWLSKTSVIPLFIKVNIIKDVACGLTYLHSHDPPILHRDLSTGNILLNKNLDAKIADLGLAKALETATKQRLSTVPGTLAFMPPEARKHEPVYTDRLDIFSLGCVIVHTVTEEFPEPTDEHAAAPTDRNKFVKIPESKRRDKFMESMREKCPYLTYLALDCLKDSPMDRPDADMVFSRIDRWWSEPELHENCSDSLLQHSELDKASLIVSLDSQATRTEELESVVKQYEAQVHQLATSTSSKDEQISSLVQNNNDQLVSMKSQQSEIDQLKSQCDKLSQQSSSEIVMNLSNMLRHEQDDMREKQEEIKSLKLKVNNLEKTCATLKKEGEEKEQHLQEDNHQLKLDLNKEAELIEVITNEKEVLINEKKKLSLQLQNHIANLQSRQKEVEDLKAELEKAEKSSTTLEGDKQSTYKKTIEKSYNSSEHDTQSSKHDELQDHMQVMSAKVQKMKEENEKLRHKLQQGEEMYQKLSEETEQKIKKNSEYWRVKTESADVGELQAEKHRLDQENKKLKQQVLQASVPRSHHLLTELNKNVKEMQITNERFANREKQMHQTIEKQKEEICQLSIAKSTTKHQLEEKSIRISVLRSQLNTCQQKLDVKDKEFSDMQSQNETLQKLLTNESNLHRSSQKELEIYKTTHKNEVSTDEDGQPVADLHKHQNMIDEKEKQVTLLNESLQESHEVILQHQGRIKDLEKENKRLAISHSKSSRQLESKLKDNAKQIESLEKKTYSRHSSRYRYNVHWSPYLSLPVKTIKPSAAIVKDKVFVTGGYQEVSPQGRELDSYLKTSEKGNEVFCFHTGKCRCDSIASPVVLGGVASVNGQCVLVSGAEGNTLTGNVYVLCEEGSDEQWKKFSEPVPTPRILPCVCCYGERWLIVCGGYAYKEGSNLLEAVNVVEILDTKKGEWHTLPEAGSPKLSIILACSVVGDDVYITGDGKVLRISCNELVSAISLNDMTWSVVPIGVDEVYPFSVVDVNGEPMIIASISGSEDDVTCVLMKDTTDTWRKMSEAVECQHCSAVVVTPTLELLLFGGSGNVQLAGGTDVCHNGTLIPTVSVWDNKASSKIFTSDTQENASVEIPIVAIRPPAISFTGPIHTKQFDYKGGTFQSPVHKVSIVVPPNAIDDGEKVTVHMGATTSGPFDLPEDCKLRSAVVWLGSGSDVVLKRSIAVVVPHSAMFTSPQHHSMMRFLTCEDCEGPRYKFEPGQSKFEITQGYGLIRLQKPAMVAITSQLEPKQSIEEDADNQLVDVPVCYIANLLWPQKSLPVSFRADVFCIQNIPTELYKVDMLYRKSYYKENKIYPEVVRTKLTVQDSELKCVLPCNECSECSCFTGWNVTCLTDLTEEDENIGHIKIDTVRFSFKFSCSHPGAFLSCCFELQGATREGKLENLPKCLKSRYAKLGTSPPILLQSGVNTSTKGTGSGDGAIGSHDQEKL